MNTLTELNDKIVSCTRCPRLVQWREEVARTKRRMYLDWDYWGKPVPGFGDPAARVLIIGLAPAAHGANRTGRVFTGDDSGNWLYTALHNQGWANKPISTHRCDGLALTDAYVSAVARCAPPKNRPTPEELSNCAPFLQAELGLLKNLEVVIALGSIAFDRFLRLWKSMGNPVPTPKPRFGHNVVYDLAPALKLVGSYHPSRQNTQTGTLTREMLDAAFTTAKSLLSPPIPPPST